jgi:hypothetical protein
VRSSEPDDARGYADGSTTNDTHCADGYLAPVDLAAALKPSSQPGVLFAKVRLRAERSDTGPGRTYTFEVRAVDAAGNSVTKSCTVRVPKSHSCGGK